MGLGFLSAMAKHCYVSADTRKVSSSFTYSWLIINIFLKVKLYRFSQNYKATFRNKALICEEMKPWLAVNDLLSTALQKCHFLPLPWKEFAVAVPAQTAHLQKPRAAHAGSTGTCHSPHLQRQPRVSRSWSCYTYEAPCTACGRRAPGLRYIFFLIICCNELFVSTLKQENRGRRVFLLFGDNLGTTLGRPGPHLAW